MSDINYDIPLRPILTYLFIYLVTVDEIDGEDEGMDDFERLKSKREKERRIRYTQKLMARSVSAQQVNISNSITQVNLTNMKNPQVHI